MCKDNIMRNGGLRGNLPKINIYCYEKETTPSGLKTDGSARFRQDVQFCVTEITFTRSSKEIQFFTKPFTTSGNRQSSHEKVGSKTKFSQGVT